MKLLENMSKELGISVVGLIILIIAFVVSGTWVVFIPIILIAVLTYFIYQMFENVIISAVLSYYGTSVIMSTSGLLIFYFPKTIGGGLFESGYVLADYITLNNIIDLLLKIQTDSWGITYNWLVVISFLLMVGVWVFRDNFEM